MEDYVSDRYFSERSQGKVSRQVERNGVMVTEYGEWKTSRKPKFLTPEPGEGPAAVHYCRLSQQSERDATPMLEVDIREDLYRSSRGTTVTVKTVPDTGTTTSIVGLARVLQWGECSVLYHLLLEMTV